MTTYRVVQVGVDGSLELAERELIAPGTDRVRIAVEACGVCGTDEIVVGPHAADEPCRVPGHEVVGRIDALGAGVAGWSLGERVGVGYFGGHCGVCEPCRRGNFVACLDQPSTGITVDGGYADYLYARPSGLVRIPGGVDPVAAAPLLCAGLTTYNPLWKARLRPDTLVAIQGIGGLGHLGVQYAKRMGARVVAIARGPEKSALARKLGADHYIDSVATDPAVELKKLGGAEIILATASSGAAMGGLIGGLARGGQLIVVGVSTEPIEVAPRSLIRDDVHVSGSMVGTTIENEDNVRFAVRHDIAAMTEVRPLADAPAAYARMLSGRARFRMVLTTAA